MTDQAVEPWLRRWRLTPDGPARSSPTGVVLPVRHDGRPAILKLATIDEERRGGTLMAWWDGDGAAPVLACEGDGLLLVRAEGVADLATMSRAGRDDEACRILCAVVARLHAPRVRPPPELVPLDEWFRDLRQVGAREGGILRRCADTAADLLATPREVVPLHGDVHHGNVLDFGNLGWLAIDPKSLLGERGFDYANMFLNPDTEEGETSIAVDPVRFRDRLNIVANEGSIDRERLVKWVLAWTGLSAVWSIADRQSPQVALQVATLAEAELSR